MNSIQQDILISLCENRFKDQREIAGFNHCSLGMVNKTIKQLENEGCLNPDYSLTEPMMQKMKVNKTKRAVILAAGPGIRMMPLNNDTPKGLIVVKGETLIERLIKQLHAVGITDIRVVVGHMKESFEFLVDEYGVQLIVNMEYHTKNNIYSLFLALDCLADCYIVPCDLYFQTNPFRKYEIESWYMISDKTDPDSTLRCTRKMDLILAGKNNPGNRMVGVSYIHQNESVQIQHRVSAFLDNPANCLHFWEDALYSGKSFCLQGRLITDENYAEINTYEDLLSFDGDSDQLKSEAISTITSVLHCEREDILNITPLKKGMTNRSFCFTCRSKKYIMRIPGEGTDQLINREQEAKVYATLQGRCICDDVLYINPKNGYKITEFIENARCCDLDSEEDLKVCMKRLRQFHDLALSVDHTFDLFEQIEFYESLWNGNPSAFRDYKTTKESVLSLRTYIDAHSCGKVLTHIDAVPDNFLIYETDGLQQIRLIDWEYAGMQDPHVDIAMFIIYSMYDRAQADRLIDIYFENDCTMRDRLKIYCYIAVCGLLWSNWCEYKRILGVEFGEYTLRQYRYAKEYYKIFTEEFRKVGEQSCTK